MQADLRFQVLSLLCRTSVKSGLLDEAAGPRGAVPLRAHPGGSAWDPQARLSNSANALGAGPSMTWDGAMAKHAMSSEWTPQQPSNMPGLAKRARTDPLHMSGSDVAALAPPSHHAGTTEDGRQSGMQASTSGEFLHGSGMAWSEQQQQQPATDNVWTAAMLRQMELQKQLQEQLQVQL